MYTIINQTTRLAVFSLVASMILSACSTAPTIEGSQILVDPDSEILVNEQATLKINVVVEGASPQFNWTAERGMISNPSAPSVIYTAPEDAGPDLVTVVVTAGKTTFTQTTTFNVVEPLPSPSPTATETALPAATSTPTAPPLPIACNHPSVTRNLFPQLEDVDGQFPMYGPERDPNILCQAVYDVVHTLGSMAVHFRYENVGPNFGWWGVATPNGYDASQHRQLCFWAYTQTPNQSFRFKVKDTTGAEKGIVTTIEKSNEWQEVCANISEFAALGLQMDKMDNVNLGFEQPTGSAEIWVADFEFK